MSQSAIRAALQEHPDGLTALALSNVMGKDLDNTYKQIKAMFGVYIDRWQPAPPRSPVSHVAVYMLVDVPKDCPRPEAALKTLVGQ